MLVRYRVHSTDGTAGLEWISDYPVKASQAGRLAKKPSSASEPAAHGALRRHGHEQKSPPHHHKRVLGPRCSYFVLLHEVVATHPWFVGRGVVAWRMDERPLGSHMLARLLILRSFPRATESHCRYLPYTQRSTESTLLPSVPGRQDTSNKPPLSTVDTGHDPSVPHRGS